MRFVHLSDTHLGFRQYGLVEREHDFYHAFEEAVRRVIQLRPDFVIHSGDLFDSHRPQPRAIYVAQRCLSALNQKGIRVYAITGNHDTLMRSGTMPPHVLFSSLGLRLLTENEPFQVHKGVFIAGVPYTSKYYIGQLKETLAILAKKAGKYEKSILMLHQGIEKYLPHEFELKLDEIPKNFNYYALGHIHSRIVENFGKGRLAYPGSTELWSRNEYEEFKKRGKGFFLVDMHGDEPTVQTIDLEFRREIIKESVKASGMDEALSGLKAKLGQLKAKPLLYLDVDSEGYERKVLHDRLILKLSELVLSLRVSYSTAVEKQAAQVLARSFNIEEMISQAVPEERLAKLANTLFKALSAGDDEQALEVAEDFYGETK